MADVKLSTAQQYIESNRSSDMERSKKIAMASLTPEHFSNFTSIANKYPGISKDLIMSMVSQGLNADTPGIGNIVSLDGISQLKNDAMNIKKIKSNVKEDKGFLGSISDAFKNVVYDPFKGITRVAFSLARLPYDQFTTQARDLFAISQNEKGAEGNFAKNLATIGGKNTTFGSLISDIFDGGTVDTGSGFFVNPKSKVGKDQAKAMGAYGRVNGESFTIGRGTAKSIGLSPQSNGYRTLSGIVDASLNIALDPTTWIPAGAVGHVLKGGKYQKVPGKLLPKKVSIGELKNITRPLSEAGDAEAAAKTTKAHQRAAKASNKLAQGVRTRSESKYLAAESKLAQEEQAVLDMSSRAAMKLLNTESISFRPLDELNKPVDAVSKETLAPKKVAEFVASHPGAQNGDLVKGIENLAADYKNTGGFIDGYIMLDEVPQVGKISIGAHDMEEYVVTAIGTKAPKLLDLAETFIPLQNATPETIKASSSANKIETLKRQSFMQTIEDAANDFTTSGEMRTVFQDIEKFTMENLFAHGGESLATIIAIAAKAKVPLVMEKLSDIIQDIWKVDGFTNVRSIYGGTGGVVITKPDKLMAASKAEISITASEFSDPSMLGPGMAKIMESMKAPQEHLAKTRAKAEKAQKAHEDIKRRLKDIEIFRDYAAQNPDDLQRIINDPGNVELQKIINLNMKHANTNQAAGGLAEFYRNEVGLVNGFNGELTDNFSKVLKYMLGRRFREISQVVAKETDSARIHKLFGMKLDADLVDELTKAGTVDDVYRAFLKHMGQENTDPNIFRSLSLRKEVNALRANPVATLVDKINPLSVKHVELIDRLFNRYYVRAPMYNLGDKNALVSGMADWFSSAKIGILVGADERENIINSVIRKITASTSNQERAAAVEDAFTEVVTTALKKGNISDSNAAELAKVLKISPRDKNIHTAYSNGHVENNTSPTTIFDGPGGETIAFGDAIHESQAMQDFIHMPDSNAMFDAFRRFSDNKVYGKARQTRVWAEQMGDIWRTMQLVGRVSYIIRNIAEMQMRQMFSGHDSLINHPFRFISSMIANPNGGMAAKAATKWARNQYDLAGNIWKTADSEAEHLESVRELHVVAGQRESVSDYRASRSSNFFKYYDRVSSGGESFFEGLAFTLNRWASDKFNPEIARLVINGTDAQKKAYIANLINNFDEKDNILRDFVLGTFRKNDGIRRVFLKDSSPNGLGAVKENMNADRIFTHFFDETQEHTLASQLKRAAGTGPKSHLIMDLLATGEATWTNAAGKNVRILVPWKREPTTSNQLAVLEKDFAKQLKDNFSPEDLTGSTVLVGKKISAGRDSTKVLDQLVDKFFEIAARQESKFNFGPEYTMAYWDHVGRYATMLTTKDLKYSIKKAEKSLAPITFKGVHVGFKHPVLRVMQKELKKRESKASYTHVGGSDWVMVHQMAARNASSYVKDLFYDAHRQLQTANAARLVFPFAQAQANTLRKWAQLWKQNPVPAYRFAKAFNSLTQPGTNTIYQVGNMSYDDDQGFFYREDSADEDAPLTFKMPLVGSVLGALAGHSINMKDAVQITAPVQALNLAFGQVNPLSFGVGPFGQIAFNKFGGHAFGANYEILRDLITPYGEPTSAQDIVLPSWLKKLAMYALNDSTTVQRGVKSWASYLASTGEYGEEDALLNEVERTRLFNDAEKLSANMGIMQAIFQSISPATPRFEVMSSFKDPKNKGNFMTMTMIQSHWQDILRAYPGEYNKAVGTFADTYGAKNLLLLLSGTSSAVNPTEDGWVWLNKHPKAADIYSRGAGDIVPYFFPGGDFSVRYYNWQKDRGARTQLTPADLERESKALIYSMLKSRIVDDQIAQLETQNWFVEKVKKLDEQFGGNPPIERINANTEKEKITRIGKALQDPAFKESPVYKETASFYPRFVEFQKLLNELKVSNYADLGGGSMSATQFRESLVKQAEELMTLNPMFNRMYYGVFAGLLDTGKK